VNLKGSFLWWPSEPASNPLFHLRHQDFVAKLFPTFLGIMNRHNRPATSRRSRNVVVKGAFTVPGDGSLDFVGIVRRLASYGYEGWFVVEAEQDPKISPPFEMAKKGHEELMRVMALAGYEVVQ
jgi:hypothetical protein